MLEQIKTLCRAMGATEDQEELLLPLIQAVREQLACRLRPEVMPQDCGNAFPLAAAMMAMDRLSGIAGGGSTGAVTSFTAGDLTIRQEGGSGGQTAKSLTEQAEELLAPWLKNNGFGFQGVEG